MRDNNPRYIHETIVRDIVDIISDVKDVDKITPFNRKSIKSVASASSGLTLVFPVLISDSIGIQSAGIICKAIERKAASMMQMLFSAFQIDDAKDALSYLSKFHTNLDTSRGFTMDTLMDALDKYVVNTEESAMTAIERVQADCREIEMKTTVEEDAKNNLNFVLPDNINEESLNIYKFNNNSNTPVVISEAPNPTPRTPRPINVNITNNIPQTSDKKDNKYDKFKDHWTAEKNASDYFNSQLIPSDVKKANELVPTMLTVNFTSINKDNGEPVVVNNVMIGIKAKLYPLTSLDIINRVKLKNQDNNGFSKFIRATTREISFFKDFLFAIDKAKIDAVSQSKRGSSSKLWKVLERRSLKSKLRRTLGQTNDATAISTLVVSKEEVEYLKKTENINIEDPNVIRPIMESYNLMGVVIVDETQEVASFMFDSGDDMYEQVSFNNLEREANDGSTKKIINLMTKLAR